MRKKNISASKRAIVMIVALLLVFSIVFMSNVFAVPHTIDVQDGTIADWYGIQSLGDPHFDVNGAGPNDFVQVYVTSDATNLYVRWDVLISSHKTQITSATYGIALSSLVPVGTTRPAMEVMGYIGFDSKGLVDSIALENATTKITLPLNYGQQMGTPGLLGRFSVEAKFPFASFNDNSLTVNPITTTSILPMWGVTLSSQSFNSAVKDYGPNTGFLSYDNGTQEWEPVGTGPLVNFTGSTSTPKVQPGTMVDYSVAVTNVGDTTGAPNLLFTTIEWVLPAGFTYVAGSTTGLTTSDPTISGQTLTWTVAGSLAPDVTAAIFFSATASGTAGIYPSDVLLTSTTPVGSYNTGEVAFVDVNASYIRPDAPLNLTASGTTQTSTNLSWTAVTGAASYILYDNGIEIARNITGTTYPVTGLEVGSTHNYTVVAVSSLGVNSDPSNIAHVVTDSAYTVTVNNLTTNDNTPTITGTTDAPDGNTIIVTINGNTYSGTASGGVWSANVTNTLPDNTYTASATVSGAVSNTGTGTIIVDTIAPAITVNALTTKDNTPVITGTTDAADGSTVTLTINGNTYAGTVSGGTYSIQVTDILPDDTYTASASVSDPAGNTGTNTGTVVVDTTGPALTVDDLTTNDNTPVITGTTDAPDGSTVTLVINGHTYTGTASSGTYSIQITDVLPDDTYTASVSVADPLGNITTSTGTVVIDTQAPTISVNDLTTNDNTPTITGTTNAADGSTVTLVINGHTYTGTASGGTYSIPVTDILPDDTYTASASVSDPAGNTGTDTGTVVVDTQGPAITINDLLTNDNTPVITGTTDAADGSTVTLIINGNTYTGTVSGGTYSIQVTDILPDDTYTASVSVSDGLGNTGTDTGTVTVDTQAPTITVDDLTTNDNTPTITGTTNAADGSTVTLVINGNTYTGTASGGTYSIPVTDVLPDDTYTASASVSDAAGNTGTNTGTVIIDTAGPAITVNNLTTNDSTPVITGTTDAADGSTVTLVINGNTYTGTASGGTYSIPVTDILPDDTYIAEASVSDALGNTGTNTGTVIIDTQAPVITVNDLATADSTPVITGTTDAADGSTVTLTINGHTYTGTVSGGTYSIQVTDVLPDDTYTATASVTDAAGNTGTNTGTVIVDTQGPTITVNDLTTTDNTPVITGTTNAVDGSTVTLTINGNTYTGTASGGTYSIPVTDVLPDDTYTATASVSDGLGNTGTNTGTVVIDTAGPAITVNDLTTSDRTPTITGTTDAPDGSIVTLVINGNTYTGTASGGTYSITVTELLPNDTYTVNASVSDALGNTATNTGTVVINFIVPTIKLIKNETDMTVNIVDWIDGAKYQIWTYQEITSDLFIDGAGSLAKQWIISQAYLDKSYGTFELDGSLSFSIPTFTSPDNNYTVSVRIIDDTDNYLFELRDTFTPAEVLAAEITQVEVDGKYSKGRWNNTCLYINGKYYNVDYYEHNFKGPEIKEIKAGANVVIKAIGNLPGMTYTATILETMEQIPLTPGKSDEFTWDISGLEPRTFTIMIDAINAGNASSDKVYILFKLYKMDGVTFGEINSLTVGSTTGTLPLMVNITPSFSGGLFNYLVRENGKAPEFSSTQYASSGGISYNFTKYGIYSVYGFVYRLGIPPVADQDSFDDVAKTYVEVKRSAGTSSVDISASPSNTVAKGSTATFTATNPSIPGIGSTPLQYSFWRYDAGGYTMLKNWSSSNTLSWTPGRVGTYIIEARVKGEDAGSYEARSSLNYEVTDNIDQKATGLTVSAFADGTAYARRPVVIRASANAANGEDLLFKFNVKDTLMEYQTYQEYSADQEFIWTPREAGTYNIDVLVKNSDSFGTYDGKTTITVVVN